MIRNKKGDPYYEVPPFKAFFSRWLHTLKRMDSLKPIISYLTVLGLYQKCLNKLIDSAIHYSLNISGLSPCPMILYHCIWLEYI